MKMTHPGYCEYPYPLKLRFFTN